MEFCTLSLSLSVFSQIASKEKGCREPGLQGARPQQLQALELGDAVEHVLPGGAQVVALRNTNGHEHADALDVLLPHPERCGGRVTDVTCDSQALCQRAL